MEVLVFKTNVTRKAEVSRVQSLLTSLDNIQQVSVDLEDCDKVLRIVAVSPLSGYEIETMVRSLGLSCNELED